VSLGQTSNFIGGMVYDSSNKMLYVTNYPLGAEGNVTVINTSTNALVTNIPAGNTPGGIAIDTENNDIYVVCSGSGNVSIIDPSSNRILGNISVTQPVTIAGLIVSGSSPSDIVFDPDSGNLYVTDSNGVINVVNPGTTSLVGDINASNGSIDNILYDQATHTIYVSSFYSGAVYLINP
jgi:YVTN family beta-propeller protein